MVAAICNEIKLTPLFDENERVDTIYFGGGTPSLLTKNELTGILQALQKKFIIAGNAEITLEANPDDIQPAILQQWLQAGINRLSLGIQSFNEKELNWMNRAHNAAQAIASIEYIQEAGFENFSVDLIYGSPLQSNEDLKENAALIFKKNIPHISCYALTVEEKTTLHHLISTHKTPAINESRQAEQFELLQHLMSEAGYEQYEISNFARPGFRSRHNSSYWQGKPYYGFGPSAHSFNGKYTRRWNIANNALYIKSLEQNTIPLEDELLSIIQQMNEQIMIGLRTIEGINLPAFTDKFGEQYTNDLSARAGRFAGKNLLETTSHFIRLTPSGKFLADGIAADLFFE